MASASNLITISPSELDGWLDRARAERWPGLAIVGPSFPLSDRSEEWPRSLKAAERVIRVNTWLTFSRPQTPIFPRAHLTRAVGSWRRRRGRQGHRLAHRPHAGSDIGAEGAKAIAASLTGLTSLDLSWNDIGAEGARAIAASLAGLTSLVLWRSNIGAEGARAIAALLAGLTSLGLGGNKIGTKGAKAIAASLTGLTSLDLWSNAIGAEGAPKNNLLTRAPGLCS